MFPRVDSESGYPTLFSISTNCEGSAHSQGVLVIKLSAGATSFSPKLKSEEAGVQDLCGMVGGMWAAWPPSAVLTVTFGDIATITSKVEAGLSSASSVEMVGVNDGCSKPPFDTSCGFGLQLTWRISHIKGMLR